MYGLNKELTPSPAPAWLINLEECPAALSWSDCGRWLAAGTVTGGICVIEVATGITLWVRSAHEKGLHTLCWQPGASVLASCGQDATVRLWKISREPQLTLFDEWTINAGGNAWIEHLQWRPDGRQLAVASGRRVFLFSSEGMPQGCCDFPESTVSAISWRPAGAQLAVSGYGGVRLFDVLDLNSKPRKLNWKGSLLSLSWSPDAKIIVAGCQDNSLHFWRLPEGHDAMMSGFLYKPVQLCWSRDARWLTSGGSSKLVLWPFDKKGPEGRAPISIEWHEKPISALATAAGSRWFASGCRGGEVAAWRQLSDTSPAARMQLPNRVECLAWSPVKNGKSLAAASRDGALGIWEMMQ